MIGQQGGAYECAYHPRRSFSQRKFQTARYTLKKSEAHFMIGKTNYSMWDGPDQSLVGSSTLYL